MEMIFPKKKGIALFINVTFVVICIMNQCNSSEFCSRKERQPYPCTKRVVESFVERYKTKCDLVFNCQQYRKRLRYKVIPSICHRYDEKKICCEGWSGSRCDIHSRSPLVDYCPEDKSKTAENTGPTHVTWSTPRFSEPFGNDLHITSTYGGQSASLSWGSHAVKYTARSRNNNKEAYCIFTITVHPPVPDPVILYYRDGQTIERTPGKILEVTCYAMYSNPAMQLSWTLDSVNIHAGTKYWTEDSGFNSYKNAYNKLQLPIEREHNRKQLMCVGTSNNTIQQVNVNIRVNYNRDPIVGFCPNDQILVSSTGNIIASWDTPEFYEINGDPIVVYCNLPGIRTTAEAANYLLNWGEHDIVYTAQNIKTGREITCSFKIDVQTKRCPQLQVPNNGALVCGSWTNGNTKVCKLMCQDQYDTSLTDNVDSIYVCSGTGKWFPTPSTMDCSRTRDNAHSRMPSDHHYFAGSCISNTTQNSMITSFLNTLKNSFAREICLRESCTTNYVTVEC